MLSGHSCRARRQIEIVAAHRVILPCAALFATSVLSACTSSAVGQVHAFREWPRHARCTPTSGKSCRFSHQWKQDPQLRTRGTSPELSPLGPGCVRTPTESVPSGAVAVFRCGSGRFSGFDQWWRQNRATGRPCDAIRPRLPTRVARFFCLTHASPPSIRRRPESSSRASCCRRERTAPSRSPLSAVCGIENASRPSRL